MSNQNPTSTTASSNLVKLVVASNMTRITIESNEPSRAKTASGKVSKKLTGELHGQRMYDTTYTIHCTSAAAAEIEKLKRDLDQAIESDSNELEDLSEIQSAQVELLNALDKLTN